MPNSLPAEPRLLKEVVNKEICCGCGVCAGVCPHKALTMQFNQYGEYNPVLTGTCVDCGLCEKVCPFLSGNPNEDDIGAALYGEIEHIQHRPETGYYLNSYVGYAPDEKVHWDGASGGMVTWTLCELLQRGEVDYVITVSANPDPDKLFKFTVVSTTEDVRRCAKSAYYPVETSEVLQHALQNDGRYAMVGLPCVCKAVRLAQRSNKKLRERIVVLLGLVCGQQKSTRYTKHIARLAGCESPPVKVSFREKDEKLPASNIVYQAWDSTGKVYRKNSLDGVSTVWCEGLHNLPSCFCCDDIFAECADAAFMDAWLPEYSQYSGGTSLVLTRRPYLNALFSSFKHISFNQVIQSQAGVVEKKRTSVLCLKRFYKGDGRTACSGNLLKRYDVISSAFLSLSLRRTNGRYINGWTIVAQIFRWGFKIVRKVNSKL